MTQQPWGPPRQQQPWGQAQSGWQQPQWPQSGGWPAAPQRHTRPVPAGGYFAPPPPRRGNPLRTLFLVLSGLAAAAVLALVVVGLSTSTGESAYENEDYQVPPESASPPPLPEYPTTVEEALDALENNPLYASTMPVPIRCELPEGNTWEMSEDELDAFLTEQMACLTRAWQPPLTEAGWTEVRPPVTVYRDQVTSACGSLEGAEAVNAFYCPADQAVYFSTLMFEYLPDLRQPRVTELVMAHEYGHNVQARANILVPGSLLQANIDDEEVALEISRRTEVQADCLAGLFLHSTAQSLELTEAELASVDQALFNIGDDALSGDPDVVGNHGRGASRQLWGGRGYASSDVGVCNTFVAPASEVE
ncbi:hypothetical protein DT076_04450 [Desertihabitans brevis]|uniref:Peptidase n=1 Tax=Desertihabitans brevis TaxID=2268447 RepID=A0A367YYT2_9ACTN|nr:neutral zinc metallopeptidase [Desertihabitans brevis]RCK70669.1 hypothetical protein DT076_04450 [Desertihabitans brevis]